MGQVEFSPRLIRLRDANVYLGMDRNRFNKEVRPFITEVPIGAQGIAFDRVDLDEWVDTYKKKHGRYASSNRDPSISPSTPAMHRKKKVRLTPSGKGLEGGFAEAVRTVSGAT